MMKEARSTIISFIQFPVPCLTTTVTQLSATHSQRHLTPTAVLIFLLSTTSATSVVARSCCSDCLLSAARSLASGPAAATRSPPNIENLYPPASSATTPSRSDCSRAIASQQLHQAVLSPAPHPPSRVES
ncbi:hypothetical protein BHE74_00001729 [Ensete ventricosum]|nr:hypothetical protein GW17_00053140 [Ensete ventricosum]RWW89331.1 hypothetical protein BHE74_00001729 [Ensete ventricosum]